MTPHTHEVLNQSVRVPDVDAYATDPALVEAVARYDGTWASETLSSLGRIARSTAGEDLAHQANAHPPELRLFDRFGHRIDEVAFHPAYHQLMTIGKTHGVHSLDWANPDRAGAGVARAGLHYLYAQLEGGVCCPMTMTHAVVPSLRLSPELAAEWEPRILADAYDPELRTPEDKAGVTFGMAMTEKQGGSDVRANTTRAEPADGGFVLTGHKWFCSAPMCDAFLTLAQEDAGLSCFLVRRILPDGSRNPFFVQRLKNKLGNKSNASSEIEYRGTWAQRVGEPGRGVRTIIEMVGQTRLDVAVGAAGGMRDAVRYAVHHCRHRAAFGKTLIDQPLMRNVLADLALEVEAAVALSFRLASAFERSATDPGEAAFARAAMPVAKYWLAKRVIDVTVEALECHGGNGYVEDFPMARLYREAPLGSIWEGSGNVQCLDVLRVMHKSPAALEAVMAEVSRHRGADRRLDAFVGRLQAELSDPETLEFRARRVVGRLAVALQAGLLLDGEPAVAEAFIASRLGDGGPLFGTLPTGDFVSTLIERASVA